MALRKFKPRSPEIYLNKIKGDSTFARLGHLNGMVDDIESKKADQEVHNIPYAFVNYPESTLFNAGPIYQYPSGIGMGPIPEITLNNYHVRGILQYSGSSVISRYLGTIKIIPNTSSPSVVFPGKITGMVLASDDNVWDPESNLTCTPLADGAMMWDVDANEFNKLLDVKIMMYSYGPADTVTGEVNYALVLEAYGTIPTGDLAEALISYDFEFVTISDSKVTLWWD